MLSRCAAPRVSSIYETRADCSRQNTRPRRPRPRTGEDGRGRERRRERGWQEREGSAKPAYHHSSKKMNITRMFVIAGSQARFQRVEHRLHELHTAPVVHVPHHPGVMPGCKLTRGEQSLLFSHIGIWNESVRCNCTVAIFEDDMDTSHQKIDWSSHDGVVLYGHCERYKCTHAYSLNAYAAARLYSAWSTHPCQAVDMVTYGYCATTRSCIRYGGQPGKGLFGGGVIGQNRSMPSYIHLPKSKFAAKYQNTTILHR